MPSSQGSTMLYRTFFEKLKKNKKIQYKFVETYFYMNLMFGIFFIKDYPENDPVMKTLQEYEEKEKRKQRNSKLAKSQPPRNVDPCDNTDEDSDNDKEFVGPVLAPLHIRVKPIQEREVQLHKLTVQEIKSINKFSNYDPGTPSKV